MQKYVVTFHHTARMKISRPVCPFYVSVGCHCLTTQPEADTKAHYSLAALLKEHKLTAGIYNISHKNAAHEPAPVLEMYSITDTK